MIVEVRLTVKVAIDELSNQQTLAEAAKRVQAAIEKDKRDTGAWVESIDSVKRAKDQ